MSGVEGADGENWKFGKGVLWDRIEGGWKWGWGFKDELCSWRPDKGSLHADMLIQL